MKHPRIYFAFEKSMKREKRSDNTIKMYIFNIEHFLKYLCENVQGFAEDYSRIKREDLRKINKKHIKNYKDYICDSENKERTINQKLSAIRCFFKFLEDEEIIEDDISLGIKGIKEPKREAKFLVEEEIKKVLGRIDNIRDYTIFYLMFNTGLRSEEVLQLNIDSIDVVKESLSVIGKGNKERSVFLNDSVLEVLEKYFEYRNSIKAREDNLGNPLFLNRNRMRMGYKGLRDLFKKYSVDENITPHVTRHSCATMLIKNGVDIRKLQEILGHEVITTTQKYVHLVDDELKDAMESIKL